jgi:hypothetical protein
MHIILRHERFYDASNGSKLLAAKVIDSVIDQEWGIRVGDVMCWCESMEKKSFPMIAELLNELLRLKLDLTRRIKDRL